MMYLSGTLLNDGVQIGSPHRPHVDQALDISIAEVGSQWFFVFDGRSVMRFTIAEKLQIALLCDLAKAAEERKLDFSFVQRMNEADRVWALSRRYSDLKLGVPLPPEVEAVREVLSMWNDIESDFSVLELEEKARVKAEAHLSDEPRFPGYCIRYGREREQVQITEIFIEDLQEFRRFQGRDIRTIQGRIPIYDRMLPVWRGMRSRNKPVEVECKVTLRLTSDDLIAILGEIVDPQDRGVREDGRWAPNPLGHYFCD